MKSGVNHKLGSSLLRSFDLNHFAGERHLERMSLAGSIPSALLLLVSYGHVFLAPYTKVEESFSLHAVHDLLAYGITKDALVNFDHHTFPGAVPRSFIGPILLSAFTAPFLYLGKQWGLWKTGLSVQILVRLVLATINSLSILFLAHRVRLAFGRQVAQYTLLITATQFHVLYYASRTIPNMLAFPFVQVALGLLIASRGRSSRKKAEESSRNIISAFALLTFAAVILRLELIALIGPLAMDQLRRKRMSFQSLVFVGTAVGALSLALSAEVDSLFWGKRVWPEGAGILFNVIEGHSSEWGTSPWHHYFLVSLPRILHLSYPLAVLAMFIDTRARQIGYPSLIFIGLLSYLKHKEWRFFVYVVPSLNVCAAAGISSLANLVSKRAKYLALVAVLSTNFLLGSLSLYASIGNYPGGEAISYISQLRFAAPHARAEPLTVHITSHAAQTGASLFLHSHQSPSQLEWYFTPSFSNLATSPTLVYDKNESLSQASEYDKFDYILADERVKNSIVGSDEKKWEVLKVFEEFAGYRIQRPQVAGKLDEVVPLVARRRESVWVLEKKTKNP